MSITPSVATSSIELIMPTKKTMNEHPQFKRASQKTEPMNSVYYEQISAIPFTTRLANQITESYDIDQQVKDSSSTFYLFGLLPLGTVLTYKYMKETVKKTSYFCEMTPEMTAWVESMKPYCQDLVRNRGKLNFRPTDEEINTKADFKVYPFIVEYGGITGIGWRRFTQSEESMPV